MPERKKQIETLFEEALEQPEGSRTEWLAAACADDPTMRGEVAELLVAHGRATGILEVPVYDFLAAESVAEQVGPYRIIREIGQGGMGVVYQAHDDRLHRLVALKFLPSHQHAHPEARERFRAEAQAASALDHPNICTIYDVGEAEDGRLYIAMAYYEGQTLDRQMQDGPMPVPTCLDLAVQVASGLKRAHEDGIVHRDIKPANIMVTERGIAKILDFGVAKLEGDVLRTKPGTRIGTLAYMSPEQARGEPLDHRTDLWSLGLVLYEMLTGQRAFAAENEPALLHAIMYQAPATLSGLRKGLPPALESIVYKCLEKEPDHRFQTAEALLTALQVLQAGEAVPHLDTVTSLSPIPGNLPVSMTSFVGRRHELEQVKIRLAAVRLLTLVGPGGTGKTRLALQVAADVETDFADGIFFVPLATISEPELVIPTIAQTLNVADSPAQPILENLKAILRDRQTLLVLDNFEQVAMAAPQVASLLEHCPALKLLVTSRVALRLSGEHEFPVPPLDLPALTGPIDPIALQQFSAITLFTERARAARPQFRLTDDNAAEVAELCIRLDGLPLAIELAAARIKLFSPQAMLARLGIRLDLLKGGPRDRPARHQTLRQAIAWSYDLLSAEEQAFFRQLAVFVGGCTLEAAEAVCQGLSLDVIDTVAALIDQNLLRQKEAADGEPRFYMLETIRAFGLEQLKETGTLAPVQRVHAWHYLALAEAAEPALTGLHQKMWLERLETEHDNLRAALGWAETHKDAETGLRIGSALWRFWVIRGHLQEGRVRLERVLALPGATKPTPARAHALNGLGTLVHELSDYRLARSYLEESLAIQRATGDERGMATVLNNLGWVATFLGDLSTAQAISEEALVLCRKQDNLRGSALSLNNLGWVAMFLGDFPRAHTLFQESLALRRSLEDRRGIAFGLTNLAWVEQHRGRYKEASSLLEQALKILRSLNDKQLLAWEKDVRCLIACNLGQYEAAATLAAENVVSWRDLGSQEGTVFSLNTRAEALCGLGDYGSARLLLHESLSLCEAIGIQWHQAHALLFLGYSYLKENNLQEATPLFEKSRALYEDIGDRYGIVRCQEGHARVDAARGNYKAAIQALAMAQVTREALEAPLPPALRKTHQSLLKTLSDHLSE